ncbi:ribbon-helix-helix protein, CopG family [Pseudoglutamicibacter cumminsii]|uniref:ribbon-helix-helix protein, CopG family n=1 Tax=Pseudoglutamicibacter cumminsii TaxID=156979 RepID=UPI0019571FA3|nr:ribbon-helix-helix protein, CopG family [Pseudoglutamicibacter cumminsii]MBM7796718.1 hypothetical protein [Pseudoglutamicibacter cumminsii]
MNTNYDKLAERAERGELSVKPGTVRRGPKAAEAAQRLLMEATGATSADELTHIALGRPTLGSKGGASPVVRARVPQALKERVAEIAEREHRKESDVVRDALAAYVEVRAVG